MTTPLTSELERADPSVASEPPVSTRLRLGVGLWPIPVMAGPVETWSGFTPQPASDQQLQLLGAWCP